ncbi:MAG TPA: antibiotic biosynthesis monooxygenase [Propionibacteriaceae bacterium]|nr:antibiotic biosynthesis monooxygenase [Propionibacteriaceae bacterium]
MFAIAVRFDLKDDESARKFDALAEDALEGIKESEPETLVYAVHTVDGAPLARLFYEVYTSPEAHAFHGANERTRAFLSQIDVLTSNIRDEFLGAPVGKLF